MHRCIILSLFITTITITMSALGAAEGGYGSPANPANWRGSGYDGHFPASDLPTVFWDIPAGIDLAAASYQPGKKGKGIDQGAIPKGASAGTSKNLVWKTALPNYGNSTPVAVGDRVFVTIDPGGDPDGEWVDAVTLYCVSINDGKVLWKQPVDHLDLLPAATQKEAKALRRAELQHGARVRHFLAAHDRAASEEAKEAIIAEAKAKGYSLDKWGVGGHNKRRPKPGNNEHARKREDDFKKLKEGKWYRYDGWHYERDIFTGHTMPSPVSDGEHVYVFTNLDTVACFTMDGKRVWLDFLDAWSFKDHSHGPIMSASPVLVGDLLIVNSHHQSGGIHIAYNKKSGTVVWRHETTLNGNYGNGQMPLPMRVGNTDIVYINGCIRRVSDGHLLASIKHPAGATHCYGGYGPAPAVGDLLYVNHGANGGGTPKWNYSGKYRIALSGDRATVTTLWEHPKGGSNSTCWSITPDGARLFHRANEIDPATGNPNGKPPGSSGSNTIGPSVFGKHVVYASCGGTGQGNNKRKNPGYFTLVGTPLQQGANAIQGLLVNDPPNDRNRGKRMARVVDDYWPFSTCAHPTAYGNRIFVRSHEYLYCIGTEGSTFKQPK